MGIDFTPLVVLAMAALGVLLALPIMGLMAVAGFWWPAFFSWLWLPPAVGFAVGLILGGIMK